MPNLKWIAQPLTAFAFSMLVMLNLLLLLFWYSPTIATLNKATDQQGASLVRSLAFDATAALNSGNRAALSNILNHFTETGLVISATVTSVDDSIRLNALVMNAPNQGRSFRHPIDFSSDILGYAELVIDETPIQRWHQQAISSWVFFNLTGLVSLGGFIFWRSRQHQAAWRLIREQLASQFPSVHRQLAGSPEQQLTKLMAILGEPLNQQGQLMKHLGQRYGSSDTERLLEQIELVGDEGRYGDIALVAIRCQNWQALMRVYSAKELQLLWGDYESLMIRIGQLYRGILLPDGFSLVFGINGGEQYALDAVCAARVLHLALPLISQNHTRLSPVFGIAVSAGPAFISKTHKHGIPLPLVTGDADAWLAQIEALQPVDQVLMAEPILQHPDVNTQVEVSIVRDVTLRDGSRLEIWELERLTERDELLRKQAQTLVQTNK
ncbi:MAG: putative membrane protein affecting hemolysin expression [Reinekea sp.]|jgi:uncharacterized membrane protein affecting hemolysin expression